jgi:hypothetical protein
MQEIFGTFRTNNTSDPTVKYSSVSKTTIVYGATGKYTITLPRKFSVQYGARAQLRMGTIAGNYANVDSVTLDSSGKTVIVVGTYSDANAAAAIASDATNWVSWSIWVQE